jgi:hypothetical protein
MLALLLAAAALACPDDQIISLDLKAWKQALLKDAPGSDEQHAEMAALRIKTVPEGNDGDAPCFDKPVVEGVDLFDANLTGQHDKLVQMRFRMCRGTPDEWQSLRIATIVPISERSFCLLAGEDLSVDRALKNRACDKPGKLPLTLAFREVVEKGRNVVETRDEQGVCNDEVRSTQVTLALFRAEGFSLKKIFETPLYDAHPTGAGRDLVQRWTLSYGKTFPKAIHLERFTEGGEGSDPEDYAWSKTAGKYLGK